MEIILGLLNTIIQYEFFPDILIGIFLLVGLYFGYLRGVWLSLWRLFFIVVLVGVVYAFFMDALVNFVNVTVFELLGYNQSSPITMYVVGTPVQLYTAQGYIEQVIYLVKDVAGYLPVESPLNDAGYVAAFSLAMVEFVAFLILLLATLLVTWLVSGLLYLVWIRLMLGNLRKAKLRILGAVVGLFQSALYVVLFAMIFSPLSTAAANILNTAAGPYKFDAIYRDLIVELLPSDSLAMGYYETYVGDYRNPFGLFTDLLTFEYNGQTYDLVTALSEYISSTDLPLIP